MAYEKIVSVPSTATSGQVPQADGAGGFGWGAVDAYTKAQTLTEATKIAYGLDASAVPDDVFNAVKGLLGGGAKIATGSYAGTGTYGSSNQNSLTFDFEPKFIWLYGSMHNDRWGHLNNNLAYCTVVATDTLTTEFVGNRGFYQSGDYNTMYAKKSADGKTVQWYATNNYKNQFNDPDYTYYYIALG